MKILVCGGRDYDDVEHVYATLDRLDPHVIISGMASGADSIAAMYADEKFIELDPYPANWKRYGQRAGYVRNKKMLDQGLPDLVVAFPGGKGTAMMVKLAKAAGVRVIEMGAKGSQTMTTQYTGTDLRIMLNQAILSGDKVGEAAIKQALADEYDEIMQAQELVDKANGTDAD